MNTEFMLLAIYNKPRLAFNEVCQAIGIELQTGYNMRSMGTFPIKTSGRPITADVRDVAAHLDALRKQGEPANA